MGNDVSGRSTPSRRPEPTLVLSVLAGLLAITFLVILGVRVFAGGSQRPGLPQAAVQGPVVEAAKSATVAFLDVDYADMKPRMAKVLSLATGTFYDRYQAAEDQLVAASIEGKVKSEGTVRYVGISSVSSTRALVFVAADSTVTSPRTAAIAPVAGTASTGEKRTYRFRVELTRVKGDWLVDGLEFVR